LATTILRNTAFITIGEWVVRGLNLAFGVHLVRTLGDSALGNYATVLAFAGMFAVWFELGTTQYTQRAIARAPSEAPNLLWNIVAIRLLLGGIGLVALPLVARRLGYSSDVVFGIFLHSTTFLLFAFLTPLTNILEGNERFDLTAVFQLVNQLTWVICAFVLISVRPNFLAPIWSGVLALPLQILLSFLAIRRLRLSSFALKLNVHRWRAIVVGSLPFGLSSLTLGLGFYSDTVVLSQVFEQRVVGVYAAAYRLVFTVNSVASGFYRAVTPSLTREHTRDPARVSKFVISSLTLLMTAALPVTAVICILAPNIVRVLYGSGFDRSADALRILIWDLPFVVFNAFAGNVTTVFGLERRAARVYFLSALVSVALNVALIPIWGITAAACVTVLTDVIKTIGLTLVIRDRLHLPALARPTFGAVVATMLMGLVTLGTMPIGLVTALAVGAIVYVVAIARLQVVDNELALAVRETIGRATGELRARL
jgi:O-antigen/teichoic acid export membrane protein